MLEITIFTTPHEHYLAPWCMEVTAWDWDAKRPSLAHVPRLSVSTSHICVAAKPGTILAYGRRNVKNQKRTKSIFHYAVVLSQGELLPITKEQLLAYFRGGPHGRI